MVLYYCAISSRGDKNIFGGEMEMIHLSWDQFFSIVAFIAAIAAIPFAIYDGFKVGLSNLKIRDMLILYILDYIEMAVLTGVMMLVFVGAGFISISKGVIL